MHILFWDVMMTVSVILKYNKNYSEVLSSPFHWNSCLQKISEICLYE